MPLFLYLYTQMRWNMRLLPVVVAVCWVFILEGCVSSGKDSGRVPLVEVNGAVVYLDEALQGMPAGLSAKDSVDYVRQFLRNRVKELLVYEKALDNIPQNRELEDLVESYRRSLIVYEYQQQVLNEKIQKEVSESDLQEFYQSNSQRFVAERNLVQGILIKIPQSAPDLNKLRQLYKSTSNEAFEKMEKICVRNAGLMEYFYDKWVSFDDIMDKIPYLIRNHSEFLSGRPTLEVTENGYCYLLYVHKYVLSGKVAPYEYVRDKVRNVVMNTRKTAFIHQFEQQLVDEAEKKKKIKYFN